MDNQQRKTYMAQYNKKYKTGRDETSYLEDKYLVNKHSNTILHILPTQMNFRGSDFEEPRYCRVFGCAKKLSIEELRFGSNCVNHQKVIK